MGARTVLPTPSTPPGRGGGQVVDSCTALGEALGVEGLGPPHDHRGSSDALPAEPAPVAVGGRGGRMSAGRQGRGGGLVGILGKHSFQHSDRRRFRQTYEAWRRGKLSRWLRAVRGRNETKMREKDGIFRRFEGQHRNAVPPGAVMTWGVKAAENGLKHARLTEDWG